MERTEALIIGGGVVGLSLARELASWCPAVCVVDRGPLGREASWAGAGILPPASSSAAVHPYDQLCALSSTLHPQWADELRAETNIDTGYRPCGGIYVAPSLGEAAALRGMLDLWREANIVIESLDAQQLSQLEPGLAEAFAMQRIRAAYYVPHESQLRNPYHVKALIASCRKRGVTLIEDCEVLDFVQRSDRIEQVITSGGNIQCGQVCVSGGAWSYALLRKLGAGTGIFPVRGQMVLFSCERPPIRHIVNQGSRYLVPRDDGHVLAGSTEEEAGFCKDTTDSAISELIHFATRLVPALRHADVEQTWAGLRPGTLDGFPYMGRVPGFTNVFVAAGHFRSGLYLSPATAITMSQLMRGQSPCIDLSPFSVLRH